MFGAVPETRYDLRFQLLGIPVRVHPFFWLTGALLAGQSRDLWEILLWVTCVFVSILVHEFGHGLTTRLFRGAPSIVLWMGGGLCYGRTERETPGERLAVVLMGPGAGFILCALVMLVFSIGWGVTPREHLAFVERLGRRLLGLDSGPTPDLALLYFKLNPSILAGLEGVKVAAEPPSITPLMVYWMLVYINLLWGLVNLLPIFPLDGGHVSRILFSLVSPANGRRWCHVVSLLTSGLLAMYVYARTEDMFLTVFFGFFALVNFQLLQSIHRAQQLGVYEPEE